MSTQPAAPSKGAVSTPDKTPSSKHFQGGHVTIVVGSCKKEFIVHKDLLVFYSDYFRAAFNGSFAEATQKRITLVDVDEEVFEQFNTWLYMRKLASDDDEPLNWHALINLWVFGDRFQVPMLQNCVMDEFFAKQKGERMVQLRMAKRVYDETVSGSLLRKAVIEHLAYDAVLDDGKESIMTADCRHCYDVEMLQDLVKELDAARKNKTPYNKTPKRDKCFFHVHRKDEHC